MSDPMHSSSTSTETPAEFDSTALTLQKLERFEEEVLYESGMWIFGYGALCWLHDFNFEKSLIGYIDGFSRKFWQGNTAHRGTPEKPGRVATLVKEEGAKVWGLAVQIKDKEAFSFLHNRECTLGGYLTGITTFYPRQDSQDEKWRKPFPVILYIATPSNSLWLGEGDLPALANQIVDCRGNSGSNVEYVLKLANFLRENIPEAVDEHLFRLDHLVREEIKKRKLCLETLMGKKKSREPEGELEEAEIGVREEDAAEQDAGVGAPGRERMDAVQFTSTVPSKKLRCVDV